MLNPMRSILRAATRLDNEPLNVLTIVTHERFEQNLAKCNINITAIAGPGTRDWNKKVAPIPNNYNIIKVEELTPQAIYSKTNNIDFDCVISQNRFEQYQVLQQASKLLQLPLICIEHTDIMPFWNTAMINNLSNMRGDYNVYISDYNKERWKGKISDIVIEHGIDTDTFCSGKRSRNNHLLSMCNDWIGRDIPCGYSIWKRVTQNLPVRVVGDTKGLSRGTNSLEECVKELQNSRVFVNTSQYSPIPMSMLEAMACECAVVTTATCMIPELILNGKNGLISNNETKLTEYCKSLLSNSEL